MRLCLVTIGLLLVFSQSQAKSEIREKRDDCGQGCGDENPFAGCDKEIKEYENCMNKGYGEEARFFKADQLIPDLGSYERDLAKCLKKEKCDYKNPAVTAVFGKEIFAWKDKISFESGEKSRQLQSLIRQTEKCSKSVIDDQLVKNIENCVKEELPGLYDWTLTWLHLGSTVNLPNRVHDPYLKVKRHQMAAFELGTQLLSLVLNSDICSKESAKQKASKCIKSKIMKSEKEFLKLHTLEKQEKNRHKFCEARGGCLKKMSSSCKQLRSQLQGQICSCSAKLLKSSKMQKIAEDYLSCVKLSSTTKIDTQKTLKQQLIYELKSTINKGFCEKLVKMSKSGSEYCESETETKSPSWEAVKLDLKNGNTVLMAVKSISDAAATESYFDGLMKTPKREKRFVTKDVDLGNPKQSTGCGFLSIYEALVGYCRMGNDPAKIGANSTHLDDKNNTDCQCSHQQNVVKEDVKITINELKHILNFDENLAENRNISYGMRHTFLNPLLNEFLGLLSGTPAYERLTFW